MRWFGVRRWVVVQLPRSWPTDRRNGNNDTTKSKCNNSYIGNMHQWVRAGTKTSSFRINNGGGALLEIDLPHCSKKGTGTQRIREGGWMGVCVLERWERLAAITAASIVVAAAAAVAGLPVAVHGLHCYG